MPGENILLWSKTAAANANADPLINFVEGQPRASLNDSNRGVMAAIAKYRDLNNGSIVTAGLPNAQSFSSGVGFTAPLPAGLVVKLKVGAALTNTAAATLEMDSIGAVDIKTQLGAALTGGELVAGTYIDLISDGTNWILLTPVPVLDFSTGDIKWTMKTTADTGWIMWQIGTIGNASSTADLRANADTQALFALYYGSYTDAICPLKTSTGAATTRVAMGTALEAFTANCQLTLPPPEGRVIGIAGDGGTGFTSRAIGETVGAESHNIGISEMPSHFHGTVPTSAGIVSTAGFAAGSGGGLEFTNPGGVTAPIGGGSALSLMQPTVFINAMIKL